MGKKQKTIDTVEVTVGARKMFIPRISDPEAIKEIADIPQDRMLIVQNRDQRRIYKSHEPIKAEEGDIFNDIPVYEPGNQNIRLQMEVYALRTGYPKVTYDKDNFLWVCLHEFDLPPGLNKKKSGLLIEVPPNYPFGPPKNFFIDRTITTRSGHPMEHYYPNEEYNKYYERGWAWFCVHIKSWKVNGNIAESDSILTAVDLAYLALQDMAKKA